MSRHFLVLICFFQPIAAHATHVRGGQIRVVSTNGLTCQIEMRILTNTGSEIKVGEGLFDFGDGTTLTTDTKENTLLLPNVGLVVYNFTHTYAAPGTYVLSYLEPNLTGGILNMPNSVETRFYIESVIVLSATVSNSSPKFPTDPIFVCPSHRTYSFSTAAIDDSEPNDFFYTYGLITDPKKERGQAIGGYTLPGNISINQSNGIVTWDTKFNGQYIAGMFWIVVRIDKYSKAGIYVGHVLRATQIIVEDSNSRIDLTTSVADPNKKVVAVDGQEKKIRVILSDNDQFGTLSFDVYYNNAIKDNISITQYDSTAGDNKFRVAVLTLKTTSNILSDNPYPVTLRGQASYRIDVTFLYMTKDIALPQAPPPPVITGLTDHETIKVYPNPFRSEIYVGGTSSTEAMFFNNLGQVVMTTRLQQGEAINTANLPAGLYLLQIRDKDGGRSNYKVVRD